MTFPNISDSAVDVVVIACGAGDPEMQAIERIGTETGCVIAYAWSGGRRVHPGTAYRADELRLPDGTVYAVPTDAVVIRAECDGPVFGGVDPSRLIVCDHHRPGDPGYSRPPEEYLSASTIGQVLAALARLGRLPDSRLTRRDGLYYVTGEEGLDYVDGPRYRAGLGYIRWRTGGVYGEYSIPADVVMAAAADHCLAAAYQGRCPGVDPDALMGWRAEERAAYQQRPVSAVLADIAAARERLREAVEGPQCKNCGGYGECFNSCDSPYRGGREYADLRGQVVPELPEAAAREGIPCLATVRDRDCAEKVVLLAAPAPLVRRFLAGDIVPGLANMYGDPERGYAGGYTQDERE